MTVVPNLALFGVLTTWLTPMWLLSVGVALGLVVLLVVYGGCAAVNRPLAAVVSSTLREGILLPIMCLAVLLSGLALLPPLLDLLGRSIVPTQTLMRSVMRIGSVGAADEEVTVPALTRDFPIDLKFRPTEIRSFQLKSDEPITVVTKVSHSAGPEGTVKLQEGKPFSWRRHLVEDKPFSADVTQWTATNLNAQPARLQIHTVTDIQYPEVRVVPWTAISLVALVAMYVLLRLGLPKVSAIALTTAKESIGQPLFYVVLAIGGFFIFASIFIPYNTFGEDVKMLKDSGLTAIMVLSIIVAVWSASVSIADEIEGRTALTLLSKPIRRWQFIFGKFLGVLGPVLLLFIILGWLFLFCISFKVVYDAREVAQGEPTWQLCYIEVIRTVPGLVLAFLETTVLAAISVAISTRLPMLANLIVCSSIYVLGNLVPLLANSSVGKLEYVPFIAQLIATVLPVLEHFNIQPAIAGGAEVPLSYLGMALLYCVLYSSAAMLLALAMFEDRDLA